MGPYSHVISSDFQVKIVMVGDVGAGKTSFLNRYIEDKFIDEDTTAVPAEFVRLVRVFIPDHNYDAPACVLSTNWSHFFFFRKRNSLSIMARQFAYSL